MTKTEIIKPNINDLETVVAVENAAWPNIGEGMVADTAKFATRLELGLMWLLFYEGKAAGIISYQYPSFTNASTGENILTEYKDKGGFLSWKELTQKHHLPQNWYEATNNGMITTGGNSTHNPSGDCVFLIGVGVDASLKGKGLVNHLIAHSLKEAKASGKKMVLGYGRLPQLHQFYETATIQQAEKHLQQQKPGTTLPADFGARFHVVNGAKAISVIPNAMDDPESLDYGFLALYDLR